MPVPSWTCRFQPILSCARITTWIIDAGLCFYCGSPLKDDPVVDHFIPWARYPNDLGHNFVLADPGCNSRKSDLLAAERHLERWLLRNEDNRNTLALAFDEIGAVHDLDSTRSVASWAYDQAEKAGARVWLRNRELRILGPSWRRLFDLNVPYPLAAEPEET